MVCTILFFELVFGAGGGSRTHNLLITSQLLCHWATPAYLALLVGLEPTTHGLTVRCSTYWTTREYYRLATHKGIEPISSERQSDVIAFIPMSHIVGGQGEIWTPEARGNSFTDCPLWTACIPTHIFQRITGVILLLFLCGDGEGNRTPVTAVKGRCLNRLTTPPKMRESLLLTQSSLFFLYHQRRKQ